MFSLLFIPVVLVFQAQNVQICEISNEAKESIRKFRFRKATTNAALICEYRRIGSSLHLPKYVCKPFSLQEIIETIRCWARLFAFLLVDGGFVNFISFRVFCLPFIIYHF